MEHGRGLGLGPLAQDRSVKTVLKWIPCWNWSVTSPPIFGFLFFRGGVGMFTGTIWILTHGQICRSFREQTTKDTEILQQ